MVRLGELNVRGLRDEAKRFSMKNYILDNKIDICCIADTHSVESDVLKWSTEWAGDSYWHHGESNYKGGTAILVKKGFKIRVLDKDATGRIIFSEILKENELFIKVACLYAPTSSHLNEQMDFLRDLIKFYEKHPGIFLGGDFNGHVCEIDSKNFEKRNSYSKELKKWLDLNNIE